MQGSCGVIRTVWMSTFNRASASVQCSAVQGRTVLNADTFLPNLSWIEAQWNAECIIHCTAVGAVQHTLYCHYGQNNEPTQHVLHQRCFKGFLPEFVLSNCATNATTPSMVSLPITLKYRANIGLEQCQILAEPASKNCNKIFQVLFGTFHSYWDPHTLKTVGKRF